MYCPVFVVMYCPVFIWCIAQSLFDVLPSLCLMYCPVFVWCIAQSLLCLRLLTQYLCLCLKIVSASLHVVMFESIDSVNIYSIILCLIFFKLISLYVWDYRLNLSTCCLSLTRPVYMLLPMFQSETADSASLHVIVYVSVWDCWLGQSPCCLFQSEVADLASLHVIVYVSVWGCWLGQSTSVHMCIHAAQLCTGPQEGKRLSCNKSLLKH